MNGRDTSIRVTGDDGARADFFALRRAFCRFPELPQSGKRKRLTIFTLEIIGLCPAAGPGALLPFIKTICEHNAAPLIERIFESWFFNQCFSARVDHPAANADILCPKWD